MAGTLYHASRFERRPYPGQDKLEHWEIESVDGGSDIVAHASWRELIDYCVQLGVPADVWPTLDNECGIDVSLEDVTSMQPSFRTELLRLSRAQVSLHELLSRVVGYLDRGETVFFSD